MDNSVILEKLKQLRNQFESEGVEFCSEVKVEIMGRTFFKSIWSEPCEQGKLIVFMFTEKGLILGKSHCLGIIKHESGVSEMLEEEQLWDIGIP